MTGIAEFLIIPLIGAALQVLLGKLTSPEVLQLFKKRGLEAKQLKELNSLFLTFTAVLTDAEEREITNPWVNLWMDELKDAIYEAEDVLGEIFTNRDQKDVKKNVENIIARLTSVAGQKDVLGLKGLRGKKSPRLPTTSLVNEHGVMGRENDKRAILEFLLPIGENENDLEANENGQQADEPEGSVDGQNQQADNHEALAKGQNQQADEPEGLVDGQNQQADKPEGLVDDQNQQADRPEGFADDQDQQADETEIPVLAIVGMPGVGKTTLAQLLFNEKNVKDKFDLRAWVHVSEEFDVLRVTKIIYDYVISSDFKASDLNSFHVGQQAHQISDLNKLQVRMQEALRGKKLLLVLDDIWNESYDNWDILKRPFKYMEQGSRIILTSRSSNVATTMRAARIHHLSCLTDEYCWSLFTKHAHRDGIDSELTERKGRILKKCGGLPLAAKTLGALLYSKEEIDEWDNILDSEIWKLPRDKSSIHPVLRLSYYHLPSHLKLCFAYCSIFPKGYQFEKAQLVQLLCTAQESVMQHKKKRRAVVADECFNELLSRSFFQQSGQYFLMHDLFIDLARDVAGEFYLRFEDGDIGEKIRHLSFLPDKHGVLAKSTSFNDANQLRTFLPLGSKTTISREDFSHYFLEKLLKASSQLRVLSLSPFPITTLHDSVSNLKYLGYLDLSHTLIGVLPDSVCNLEYLRYLDLSDTSIRVLPDSVCNLEYLWYLDLSHTLIRVLPDSLCSVDNLKTLLLLECYQLTKLPNEMKNLTNLQHLNIKGTKGLVKMPPKFGSLKNLRVLTDFVVGDGDSSISELKGLSKLRTLSIRNLEKVDNTQAEDANLKNKRCISELVFEWSKGIQHNAINEEDVLDRLQPHENLEKLTIKNYGGNVIPTWSGTAAFSKMVYLHLVGCDTCSSLPSLGQLCSLKELHIANMENIENVGYEFCHSDSSSTVPFKSLEILKFENMRKWSSFTVEQFPRLQKLHLHNCPCLTNILPKHLPSLNTLRISGCPTLKMEFLEEGTDRWYKTLKNLEVRNSCDSLISFPLDYFTELESLLIDSCSHLQNFRHSHSPHPICLQKLEIEDCPALKSFDGAIVLSNLQSLSIKNCNQLIPQVEWDLHTMAKLNSFEIESKCNGIVSFPIDGLLPDNLDSLYIRGLPDLSCLNHNALKSLTILKTLEIDNCLKFDRISDGRLPLSLVSLTISECPSITEQHIRDQRENVSHISEITIDGENINVHNT